MTPAPSLSPGQSVKEMLEEKARLAREARKRQVEQDRLARLKRAEQEAEKERMAQARLAELQKRWAEASKVVEKIRDESYVVAGARVAAWKERQKTATDKCYLADSLYKKKMSEAWYKKEERFQEWLEETEQERQRKAREFAAKRDSAKEAFQDELKQRDNRLESAQQLAERRRQAKAEEKRRHLQAMRELAEERLEASWQARLRVMKERDERCKEIEAECKRKAAQGEACLQTRRDQIEFKAAEYRKSVMEGSR